MKLKNKRVILNVIFIYKTHILYRGGDKYELTRRYE